MATRTCGDEECGDEDVNRRFWEQMKIAVLGTQETDWWIRLRVVLSCQRLVKSDLVDKHE